MFTTFARLAKVLKGYIKPANWIERAFASVASALVPSFTVADDGKVLGVTKNEDDKAVMGWVAGGGGGGDDNILVVHITGTPDTELTADKTVTEIYEASQNGKVIIASVNGSISGFATTVLSSTIEFSFVHFSAGSPGDANFVELRYDSIDGISVYSGNVICDS